MKKRGFGIKVLLLATLILVIAICLFLFIKNDKFSIIINFYKNEEQVNNKSVIKENNQIKFKQKKSWNRPPSKEANKY